MTRNETQSVTSLRAERSNPESGNIIWIASGYRLRNDVTLRKRNWKFLINFLYNYLDPSLRAERSNPEINKIRICENLYQLCHLRAKKTGLLRSSQ